jgi:hypothetical protein
MHGLSQFALALLLTGPVAAVGAETCSGQAFHPLTFDWAPGGILRMTAEDYQSLLGHERVRLQEVPLPQILADLELVRFSLPFRGAALHIDGAPRPSQAFRDLSLWSGQVSGQPQSDVYLAFSPYGSRGWIETDQGTCHLVADPDSGGVWEQGFSRLIAEEDQPLQASWRTSEFRCAVEEVAALGSGATLPQVLTPRTPSALNAAPLPLIECRLAVETDWQYYRNFNDVAAAEAYALELSAAVSLRYRNKVGTLLTIHYLGLHTQRNDGWSAQDGGGNCIDVFHEFRTRWGGHRAPVPADLHHFLSGANLGCGVGALAALCDPDFGFSVSGNVSGASPLGADFYMMAHELGHNFGAIHTHEFCPPIDECAPNGFRGPCQTATVCRRGTIMSYCHLCPGGGLRRRFHDLVAASMRDIVEISCLQPFEGVLQVDQGQALAGSTGTPVLELQYDPGADLLTTALAGAPVQQPGFLVVSPVSMPQPFFGGGTLVPAPDLICLLPTDASGSAALSMVMTQSFPSGGVFFSQAWFADPVGPSGWAASNAVQGEVIRP